MAKFLEQEFCDENGNKIEFYGDGTYLPPASLTPGIAITSKNNGRKYKIIEHEFISLTPGIAITSKNNGRKYKIIEHEFIKDENEKDKTVQITLKEI